MFTPFYFQFFIGIFIYIRNDFIDSDAAKILTKFISYYLEGLEEFLITLLLNTYYFESCKVDPLYNFFFFLQVSDFMK